jgi:hypothetical protein
VSFSFITANLDTRGEASLSPKDHLYLSFKLRIPSIGENSSVHKKNFSWCANILQRGSNNQFILLNVKNFSKTFPETMLWWLEGKLVSGCQKS